MGHLPPGSYYSKHPYIRHICWLSQDFDIGKGGKFVAWPPQKFFQRGVGKTPKYFEKLADIAIIKSMFLIERHMYVLNSCACSLHVIYAMFVFHCLRVGLLYF